MYELIYKYWFICNMIDEILCEIIYEMIRNYHMICEDNDKWICWLNCELSCRKWIVYFSLMLRFLRFNCMYRIFCNSCKNSVFSGGALVSSVDGRRALGTQKSAQCATQSAAPDHWNTVYGYHSIWAAVRRRNVCANTDVVIREARLICSRDGWCNVCANVSAKTCSRDTFVLQICRYFWRCIISWNNGCYLSRGYSGRDELYDAYHNVQYNVQYLWVVYNGWLCSFSKWMGG